MKRTLLIGCMSVVLALVGSRAEASDFELTTGDALCTTGINANLNKTDLMAILNGASCDNQGVSDPFSLLYKSDAGGGESGTFSSSYDTGYSDPNLPLDNATISYQPGTLSMGCLACYLVVKDGNKNPAQYFFDISGWNGTDNIVLTGFWPGSGTGTISNVAIWGSAVTVPEPATLLLLGTGLGLAALRQRRRRLA